jgi:hypothetical protein
MTISETALRLKRPVHDVTADVEHGLIVIRILIIKLKTSKTDVLAFWLFCDKKS